ncbi:YggS family pyridoxal phosphate-dependent enzyme [Putridiphycobacter roseus]|uniref:Pyridoxal phosphate homeostasis protein n=1 Tax=Putridiphycobacter roseus TaxID=2219161 RepID=A0A2W1N0C2_9FLAO|nr:YggS family pyridoxal phosphate-dependent enzyme [Putridiphycobacter roseus]PZE17657.1 YggS family pyridoxal phosphate-dependent enzyme [Putridiphycobacter roseus]
MVQEALKQLKENIPARVTLVAVSKTKPKELIQEAYAANQRIFGENKAQEMAEKHLALPKDIEWHFIGHLQSNKIKYIAPFVSLIHAVDSVKLLKKIDQEGAKNERIIPVLLQFHIAKEASKFGFNSTIIDEMVANDLFTALKHVEIRGVMGMATFTENEQVVKEEFDTLKHIFDTLKSDVFNNESSFKEISMGMSGDYPIAIAAGSTMIRVGSAIFGSR